MQPTHFEDANPSRYYDNLLPGQREITVYVVLVKH